jgi:hypothetical protein
VTFAKKFTPGDGNVSCDSAPVPVRATWLAAASAFASSFAMRAYRARRSCTVLVRLTPGVRMVVLKNVLGACAARTLEAESSSSRTYGSATARDS